MRGVWGGDDLACIPCSPRVWAQQPRLASQEPPTSAAVLGSVAAQAPLILRAHAPMPAGPCPQPHHPCWCCTLPPAAAPLFPLPSAVGPLAKLNELKLPAFFLCGEFDRLCPGVRLKEVLAEALPDCDCRVVVLEVSALCAPPFPLCFLRSWAERCGQARTPPLFSAPCIISVPGTAGIASLAGVLVAGAGCYRVCNACRCDVASAGSRLWMPSVDPEAPVESMPPVPPPLPGRRSCRTLAAASASPAPRMWRRGPWQPSSSTCSPLPPP